jgi:hypothetical protein
MPCARLHQQIDYEIDDRILTSSNDDVSHNAHNAASSECITNPDVLISSAGLSLYAPLRILITSGDENARRGSVADAPGGRKSGLSTRRFLTSHDSSSPSSNNPSNTTLAYRHTSTQCVLACVTRPCPSVALIALSNEWWKKAGTGESRMSEPLPEVRGAVLRCGVKLKEVGREVGRRVGCSAMSWV